MQWNYFQKLWNSYSYRFTPFVALNWKKRQVKKITRDADENLIVKEQGMTKLANIFQSFYDGESVSDSNGSIQKQMQDKVLHMRNRNILLKEKGFCIEIQKSCIPEAGDGVFVSNGIIRKGEIAALYPGTVYMPMQPLLFQSIKNQFILRCVDGLLIDGNNKGISRIIYRSCSGRDIIGPYNLCDESWLTHHRINPLAIGQFVNNGSNNYPANVSYHEIDLLKTFPLHLRKFIPNVYYEQQISSTEEYSTRVVALVAIRNIAKGEELFSSYFTEIR